MKPLVFLNCCSDHSTIKCGKQPLRFGGKSPQSFNEAENRFGGKHLKRKLRAVPGCRCQIAQNHYQKERDVTLNCALQVGRQKPRTTYYDIIMIFRQGAQHRRFRSLTFASTITPDCGRHALSFETQQTLFRSH